VKKEKNEAIKALITAIELNIDTIKKSIEIVKYLADSINGMAAGIDYSIREIENDVKALKIRLGIKDGDKFE
jgi:hypothetical protein